MRILLLSGVCALLLCRICHAATDGIIDRDGSAGKTIWLSGDNSRKCEFSNLTHPVDGNGDPIVTRLNGTMKIVPANISHTFTGLPIRESKNGVIPLEFKGLANLARPSRFYNVKGWYLPQGSADRRDDRIILTWVSTSCTRSAEVCCEPCCVCDPCGKCCPGILVPFDTTDPCDPGNDMLETEQLP